MRGAPLNLGSDETVSGVGRHGSIRAASALARGPRQAVGRHTANRAPAPGAPHRVNRQGSRAEPGCADTSRHARPEESRSIRHYRYRHASRRTSIAAEEILPRPPPAQQFPPTLSRPARTTATRRAAAAVLGTRHRSDTALDGRDAALAVGAAARCAAGAGRPHVPDAPAPLAPHRSVQEEGVQRRRAVRHAVAAGVAARRDGEGAVAQPVPQPRHAPGPTNDRRAAGTARGARLDCQWWCDFQRRGRDGRRRELCGYRRRGRNGRQPVVVCPAGRRGQQPQRQCRIASPHDRSPCSDLRGRPVHSLRYSRRSTP